PKMTENVRFGKNLVLAVALANGETAVQAAERVGVSDRTVRRKLARPKFRQLVNRLRDQMFAHSLGAMARSQNQAVETFVKLPSDEDPNVRLRAARAIVGLGLRVRDSV